MLLPPRFEAAARLLFLADIDISPDANMSTVQLQPDHTHFILVGTRDDKDEPSSNDAEQALLEVCTRRVTHTPHLDKR